MNTALSWIKAYVPDLDCTPQEYLDELKSVACCYGFSPESVDRLLESGFSTDDIEEFLYEGEMY